MSQLTQRVKKLEDATPSPRLGYGLAIPEEGETPEQAIARVLTSKPCRKVYVVEFVEAPMTLPGIDEAPGSKQIESFRIN